jgi:hypothetical protein
MGAPMSAARVAFEAWAGKRYRLTWRDGSGYTSLRTREAWAAFAAGFAAAAAHAEVAA